MGYTPTSWKNGDSINSTKLNKIEQAVANGGGGVFNVIATTSGGSTTLDKTYNEILSALLSGKNVIISSTETDSETGGTYTDYSTVNDIGENYDAGDIYYSVTTYGYHYTSDSATGTLAIHK
jgi:hypothetical protein